MAQAHRLSSIRKTRVCKEHEREVRKLPIIQEVENGVRKSISAALSWPEAGM